MEQVHGKKNAGKGIAGDSGDILKICGDNLSDNLARPSFRLRQNVAQNVGSSDNLSDNLSNNLLLKLSN
jgi:hypothetical protein